MQSRYPINLHKAYHAHVYFDASTTGPARVLCARIAENFGLEIGRFHEKKVGPHPMWSCQIKFSSKDFDEFIPWLNDNRGDLTIFVHARSGDDLRDHTEFAYWLGPAQKLKLDMFK